MKNMNGFQIRHLWALGDGVEPAHIALEPGLNVITGPSDTGKSYIFDCIRFALGATESPEAIVEAKTYKFLELEIESYSGTRVRIRRELRRDGKVYALPPEGSNTQRELHKVSRDMLSERLLSLSGLTDKVLLTSVEKGATSRLTFADARHFSMLDESRIIGKTSPVFPQDEIIHRTRDRSAFDILISGSDFRDIERVPPALKMRIADWHGRDAVYETMIRDLRNEVGDAFDVDSIAAESRRVEDSIQECRQSLGQISEEAEGLLLIRREIYEQRRHAEADEAAIEQLLRRFTLLMRSYQSDIERLEFIREGAHASSQLGDQFCAVCGSRLELGAGTHVSLQQQHDSVAAEILKIRSRVGDLEATIKQQESDHELARSRVAAFLPRIQEFEDDYNGAVRPRLLRQQRDLEVLLERQAALRRTSDKGMRLSELLAQRRAFGPEPRRRKKGEPEPSKQHGFSTAVHRHRFCERLENVLRDWAFPNIGTVEFVGGEQEMELFVGGASVRTHGKGLRAVASAAFAVALLDVTVHAGLGHPGFVVMDSPLSSYRPGDSYEAPQNVQMAFFADLVRRGTKRQFIVLENKEPPFELRERMNYIHFTGSGGERRRGFYPQAKTG